ncbi:hypothetical protein [Aurantimonas sp. VKM B-3413]|uniref:hypothetical protein n=1 Tax=Aurantimonas sp. VKM B-3413 TaxID=2779401 RepID=UPI001E486B48|nr:hypothetical protein [Aurantimonas sp. VKM B-3413]MCB8837762.1 hypothetical protein [Aurantimonas sp. VKM B-3413]
MFRKTLIAFATTAAAAAALIAPAEAGSYGNGYHRNHHHVRHYGHHVKTYHKVCRTKTYRKFVGYDYHGNKLFVVKHRKVCR